LPLPLAPPVIVIHEAFLVAVQGQPAGAVTFTFPIPAALPKSAVVGEIAYVWTGAKNIRRGAVRARIKVDGEKFFDGDVSCVLAGNVGALFGGVFVVAGKLFVDGSLEVAVVTATNLVEWSRAGADGFDRGRLAVRTRRSGGSVPAVRARCPTKLDGGDRYHRPIS
jgi:hypothetical protein